MRSLLAWLVVLTALAGGEAEAPLRYGIDAGGYRVVVDLFLPELPADRHARLQAAIAATLPGILPGQTIMAWATSRHAQVLADNALLRAAQPDAASARDWYDITVVRATWSGGGLLCLHALRTWFAGGAHTNTTSQALIVDAATLQPVTLDALIRPQDHAAFSALLTATWRRQQGLPELARLRDHGLSVDALPVKLPQVTAAGLEVLYHPYEVGPFSTGQVRIDLTRAQARPFLRLDPWSDGAGR